VRNLELINKELRHLIIYTLRSQCVIYDSDEPNARLIGIEYIISENVFKTSRRTGEEILAFT